MKRYLIVTENIPHQICGYCEDFNPSQQTYWYNGNYGLLLIHIQSDFNQPIKLVPITVDLEKVLNDMLTLNLTSCI